MIGTTRLRKGPYTISYTNSPPSTTNMYNSTMELATLESTLESFMAHLAREFLMEQVPALLIALMEHLIVETEGRDEKKTKEQISDLKKYRRYRTMEAAANRLQKESKGYLDSLRGTCG
jgi:hypothetical protein